MAFNWAKYEAWRKHPMLQPRLSSAVSTTANDDTGSFPRSASGGPLALSRESALRSTKLQERERGECVLFVFVCVLFVCGSVVPICVLKEA